MKEKTYVEDIDRSMYDFRKEEKDVYRVDEGLTPEIVEQISKEKNDPAWMQLFRLQSLQIYNSMKIPDWGPPIDDLNMDQIVTYVRPNTKMSAKWSDVPEDIKDTFERLGIPQAERKSLAGVGAQYDSELVYHNVKAEVAAQGVVYTDLESAMHGEYADMIRTHFMKLVKPNDHKFAALHGAVWSGGSFVYVPPGVSVEIPLQSYFRLNAPGTGEGTPLADGSRVKVQVIEVGSGKVADIAGTALLTVAEGQVHSDVEQDVLKTAVFERHHETGKVGFGFCKGFGIRCGAMASTVAHDAHNLLVVGTNDADMALAANTLIESKGGMAVVQNGRVLGVVPLPIAGLMNDKPAEEMAAMVSRLTECWEQIGCTMVSPFMTMALIPLACLPELRLTDRGLVDVAHKRFLPLIEERRGS